MRTSELRCEYLQSPLGIDTPRPRLSWQLVSDTRGGVQTAYQVQAATTRQGLLGGEPDIWDSGPIHDDAQLVAYSGPLLRTGRRVWWRVRVWDADRRPGSFSDPAWFEMGLLNPEDWRADWIGFPAGWNGKALYFRRPFHLPLRPVRARAYVAGLGYYELRLNGRKVGDHVLDPGTTSYDRRVLYVTYDVTPYLQEGGNMVGAILGHGWYGSPQLRLQMHVELEDGTSTEILSQSGPWQVGTGPIVANSIYDGETYDARRELPGWDQPQAERPLAGQAGGDVESTSQWARPHVANPPGGRLVAQTMPPIRVVETLVPREITEPRAGISVVDFGQNFSGWARIHVQGTRGTEVRLRYAETLYADGTVNQENLRAAAATDTYILAGAPADPQAAGALETWEPRFTYHGFRYVQVEGYPGPLPAEAIEGRFVRSDTQPTGQFRSSNELLERIHQLVWWTEATNQHSIPTDCPQRDERMGWLNDLGARTEEAVCNFDMARFLAKWVADIHDAQDPVTGAITDTAPHRWGNRPADPVSVSYLLIPWMLYVHYGDTDTMARHFEGLKAWVDFLTSQAADHIVSYSYYGDWAPPVGEGEDGGAVSRDTPGELISTGFYFYAARLLSRISEVLGRNPQALAYQSLAAKIADAYNARFYDPDTGGYGSNNQACNAFSLYLDLVGLEHRPRVVENLVHDVVVLHDGHLTTGNLCTKYLLEVLTDAGYADVAYRIVTQETYPSWGYMLAHGATTVWERWEHATGGGMNSHNHPMYASVGAWLYRALAGIRSDAAGPGFARFQIRPQVVAGLGHVEARQQTVRGPIHSAWTAAGPRLNLDITVPAGSQATVTIPIPTAESAVRILEGKRQIWPAHGGKDVEGILAAKAADAGIEVVVGGGTYHFLREP